MNCYSTATILLQYGLLVLSLPCRTYGLTLEDRGELQQLITENCAANNVQLRDLELKVMQLENKNNALEQKVQEQEFQMTRLEETVQNKQQEQLLTDHLQDKIQAHSEIMTSSSALKTLRSMGKFLLPRTCREVLAADPSLSSGMHWIDPDGQGVGDDPIYVFCDMVKGSTSVLHDSESSMDVGHCADPGCYSRPIYYNATLRQMNALAELSKECHQSIQYDCNYAPFETNGVTFAWWNDRNGTPQTFWSGNNASVHVCQCGIDQNCVENFTTCNCDSTVPFPLTDSGVITDKNYLPITRLNFGRTQLASSSGVHTLGRFECTGQEAVSGMPSSCADLWRIGHSLSGLYSVKRMKQIESVYCDFTKLPDDLGFQTRIGYVDVKLSPVYFYVQKNSSFSTQNVPIPFEVTKLNVGGAMDSASGIFTTPRPGTYFFSFFGISVGGIDTQIGLTINGGGTQGSGYSGSNYDTLAIQSTLHLNTGDKVSMQIIYGSGRLHEHSAYSRYTHFTGWLLEEDLSS